MSHILGYYTETWRGKTPVLFRGGAKICNFVQILIFIFKSDEIMGACNFSQ